MVPPLLISPKIVYPVIEQWGQVHLGGFQLEPHNTVAGLDPLIGTGARWRPQDDSARPWPGKLYPLP